METTHTQRVEAKTMEKAKELFLMCMGLVYLKDDCGVKKIEILSCIEVS